MIWGIWLYGIGKVIKCHLCVVVGHLYIYTLHLYMHTFASPIIQCQLFDWMASEPFQSGTHISIFIYWYLYSYICTVVLTAHDILLKNVLIISSLRSPFISRKHICVSSYLLVRKFVLCAGLIHRPVNLKNTCIVITDSSVNYLLWYLNLILILNVSNNNLTGVCHWRHMWWFWRSTQMSPVYSCRTLLRCLK